MDVHAVEVKLAHILGGGEKFAAPKPVVLDVGQCIDPTDPTDPTVKPAAAVTVVVSIASSNSWTRDSSAS